jgi:hypothetical protein
MWGMLQGRAAWEHDVSRNRRRSLRPHFGPNLLCSVNLVVRCKSVDVAERSNKGWSLTKKTTRSFGKQRNSGRSSRSKELGEDYWIDEKDLERERQRIASRPLDPGQIPEQKLWKEVLSPYRQNWIGYISVVFVILATIITKFPELLSTPPITIPDL